MRERRPTIYDVAQRAGVSKSLVSLVLQGSPRVSDASRAAIETAIAELDYRPSSAAAQLAAGATRLVGVLIDDYTNLWFVDLVRGLQDVLAPEGYRLTVIDVATARGDHPVDELLSMRVDGLVVAMDVPDALRDVVATPMVIAGTREQIPRHAGSVANDDEAGARLAAAHLLDLGHRSIGHVSAAGGAALARRAGFRDALRDAEITEVPEIAAGTGSEGDGYEAALALLRAEPGLTAIFAANDLVALGVLGAARTLGRDVPADLSVIGYDDTPVAATHLIDLTTIDDSSAAVGRAAGRLLLRAMSGQADAEHVSIEPTLVVRGTTAPSEVR
ncbi:LacI family DNA-binding transcriptional regulator [Microbacterium sp. NPDC089696]|uniref:LacI family DNA-binding transcriptional regulator n=1 Tax=Microbacterium sp. NPDC089696 TaxID=3364199 RepID=UPI00382AD54F